MERATKKGMKYNFDYYVMICKTYKMPQPVLPSGGGRRKQKGEMEGRIFVNAEEEFFHEASKFESALVVTWKPNLGVPSTWLPLVKEKSGKFKVREKSGKFKVREKSGNFVLGQGNLRF